MDNIIFIILGMAVVTYIPRLIPFLVLSGKPIHARLDLFLKCVPVAAIGSMIVPSVYTAIPDMPIAGIAGILFTLCIGLWKGGTIIPVLGAVAVTYFMLCM